VSCFGGSNGSIDLTISGGTPPYSILWSTNDTIEDLTALPAGYYRVTVDDVDTLTDPAEAEIMLMEPRKLALAVSVYKYPNGYNISLYGACNGSVTTTVAEGVAPYTWLWSTGSTAQSITAVCAGIHTVTVTDANGCIEKNLNVARTQPDRSDWQIGGNLNIDDSTQFIGTLDGSDLVFRTDGLERARLKANGDFYINRIFSNRIISVDTVVAIGPNSINFNHNTNNVSVTPTNTNWPTPVLMSGLGIGHQSYAMGLHAIAIGRIARCTNFENAIAIGNHVLAHAENAIVIGSGFDNGTALLTNDIPNSIMIGMNSAQPTIFIAPGGNTNQGQTGFVGINTTEIATGYKFAVKSKIIAEELKVQKFDFWPDYVFESNYPILSIHEYRDFIRTYKRLPGMPSADEITKNEGVEIGEFQMKLLEKVEEQALYIIELQHQINALHEIIKNMKN
jgi:hypothetical protein